MVGGAHIGVHLRLLFLPPKAVCANMSAPAELEQIGLFIFPLPTRSVKTCNLNGLFPILSTNFTELLLIFLMRK